MADPDPADLLASIRAQGDQMRAANAELTQLLTTFRKDLVAGGFADEMADAMASAYFSVLLAGMMSGG